MARNFNELRNKMSVEAQARAKKKALKTLGTMPLYKLRRESSVKQATVSKLERRADMYISTLRRTIVDMGGQLEIIVFS